MRLALLIIMLTTFATAQTKQFRFAVGGIMHESNSFFSVGTGLDDFRVQRGEEIVARWEDSSHELAGIIEASRKLGFELHPTLFANASPAGPVADEALDKLTAELIQRIKATPKLDGVLLTQHGAMVAESYPHGDAEIVRRVREAVGEDMPIVVTHDFHANIPPEIVELSTVLLGYKTNPHIDTKDRGFKAAGILLKLAKGEARPVQAIVKPGMVYNILYQNTNAEPLRPIVEETRRLEKQPGILAATVAGGYQYADTPAMGASVVVVTDGDAARAQQEAKRLSDMLWATRTQLTIELPDVAAAVKQARAESRTPVVLVDMGDNIGGGTPGDSTFVLDELLKQKASGWVMVVADPEAVLLAQRTGVRSRFEAGVGGKTDGIHGQPVMVRGVVKSLHDGRYLEPEVRHGGRRHYDQGPTAVIEVEGSTPEALNLLMLTAQPAAPMSLQQLISCGIYPERQRILVVKAAIAYRAAYEPVAGAIIEVDSPGATAIRPSRFEWTRVPSNLFGLEQ